MENKIDYSDLEPLGVMFDLLSREKTASEKVSENETLEAYVTGVEAGLNSDSNTELSKIACRQVGRDAMRDFVPLMFLSK